MDLQPREREGTSASVVRAQKSDIERQIGRISTTSPSQKSATSAAKVFRSPDAYASCWRT